jgi:hypothetical protein
MYDGQSIRPRRSTIYGTEGPQAHGRVGRTSGWPCRSRTRVPSTRGAISAGVRHCKRGHPLRCPDPEALQFAVKPRP